MTRRRGEAASAPDGIEGRDGQALARVSLGRGASVPLYQQIYAQLREEIISGLRPLGSLVPTEHELINDYNVSRTTAKLALNKLAEQELVARKRKVGTRVTYRAPMRPIVSNISSAIDTVSNSDREIRVSVVAVASEAASESTSALLQVEPGTPLLRIERLRWLDGAPLGYTKAYLPETISDTLDLSDFEGASLVSMVLAAGHVIGSAKQTIAAVLADPGTAAFLQMHPMEPLLRITRTYRNSKGAPLLLTRAFYRADRYQADVDMEAHTYHPQQSD